MYSIDQKTREEITNNEHLNLLSIFYYIYGGLSFLGAIVLAVYLFVVYFIVNRIPEVEDMANNEAHLAISIVVIVFIVLLLMMIAVGILFIVSAINLKKRKNRTLSIVMSVFALLSFPLGTALGIFTLIVLNRASVIEMYKMQPELRKQQILNPDGL
ncbi:MAG: hypothetical protein U0W24_12625 [Bacteroidales bacterium]